MPPVVRPKMTPTEMVNSELNNLEIEAIKRHLIIYQRSGDGRNWDEYRKKIDYDLLYKWGKALKLCRDNGFINPHIWDNKIRWQQLLGSPATDKCYLCGEECSGTYTITPRGKEFKPCWE